MRDNGILTNKNLFCRRLQFDGHIGDGIVVSVIEIVETSGGIVVDGRYSWRSSVGIQAGSDICD